MDVELRKELTRDDLIRVGACFEGVNDACAEFFPGETAVSVAAALRVAERLRIANAKQYVLLAANAVIRGGYVDGGYGYGDGCYGDDDGDYGYGDGVGGYGDGYGYGGDGYGGDGYGGYGYGGYGETP